MWCCDLEPSSNEYGMQNFMRKAPKNRISHTSQYRKMQDSFDFNSHIKQQEKENFTSSQLFSHDTQIRKIRKDLLRSPSFHPDFAENSLQKSIKSGKRNSSSNLKHNFFKNKNENFHEKIQNQIDKENHQLKHTLQQKRYPNILFSRTNSQMELALYKKSLTEKLSILGFKHEKFEEMLNSNKKQLLKNTDSNLQKFFTLMDKKDLMNKFNVSAIDYMFYSKKYNIFNLKKMLIDSLNFKKSLESPLTARKKNSLYFSQTKGIQSSKINRKLGYDDTCSKYKKKENEDDEELKDPFLPSGKENHRILENTQYVNNCDEKKEIQTKKKIFTSKQENIPRIQKRSSSFLSLKNIETQTRKNSRKKIQMQTVETQTKKIKESGNLKSNSSKLFKLVKQNWKRIVMNAQTQTTNDSQTQTSQRTSLRNYRSFSSRTRSSQNLVKKHSSFLESLGLKENDEYFVFEEIQNPKISLRKKKERAESERDILDVIKKKEMRKGSEKILKKKISNKHFLKRIIKSKGDYKELKLGFNHKKSKKNLSKKSSNRSLASSRKSFHPPTITKLSRISSRSSCVSLEQKKNLSKVESRRRLKTNEYSFNQVEYPKNIVVRRGKSFDSRKSGKLTPASTTNFLASKPSLNKGESENSTLKCYNLSFGNFSQKQIRGRKNRESVNSSIKYSVKSSLCEGQRPSFVRIDGSPSRDFSTGERCSTGHNLPPAFRRDISDTRFVYKDTLGKGGGSRSGSFLEKYRGSVKG